MKKLFLTIGLTTISTIGFGQIYNIPVDRIEREPMLDVYGNFDGYKETLFTDTISISQREIEYILNKISNESIPFVDFKINGFIQLNGKPIDTSWQCDWDRTHRPLYKINQCRVNGYQIKVSHLEQLAN